MKLLQAVVLCFSVATSLKCTNAVPVPQQSYNYGYNPTDQNPYSLLRVIQSYFNQPTDFQNQVGYPYYNYGNYGYYNPYPLSPSMPSYDFMPYGGVSQYSIPGGYDDQYNPNYRSLDTDVQSAGQASAAAESDSQAEASSSSTATKK